jgi:Putative metal-binding motif
MNRDALALGALAGALLIVTAAYSVASAAAPKSQPDAGTLDAGPRPLIGTGCTGVRPHCTMPDGCSGLATCDQGAWDGPCVYATPSTRGCTECGSAGTQVCHGPGSYDACVSTTGRQCTCGPYSGTRTCQGNGTWTACVGSWTGAACVTASQCGGTQSCSLSGTLLCNPSGGTTNAPACTSTLGFAGHNNCTSGGQFLGCQPDNVSQRYEQCNGLDDNGNGQIDEGLGGGSCIGPDTACTGTTQCTGGQLLCVNYSGSKPCTNMCGDSVQRRCNPNSGNLNTCPERTELCNGEDDNCNGLVDEGDVCRQQNSCSH